MKICLIAEGSYPHVTGGVSSWIQMVISSMPEFDFIIFAIGAEKRVKGNYKYEFPSNLVKVHEFFLDEDIKVKFNKNRSFKMEHKDKISILNLLTKTNTNWVDLFSIIEKYNIYNIDEFLLSNIFYSIVENAYKQLNNEVSFINFYWNTKSIIKILFKTLSCDIPYADIYHSVSTGYAGIIGSIAKIKYNKPFLLTEHGIYTREREEEIIRSDYVKGHLKDIWINYFYSISKCTYEHADIVTTLFQKNKDIQIELSCTEEKIRIIPNGINLSSFENIEQKSDETKKTNIGAVVRMVPIKDIKTMIQSFSIVKEEIRNAMFYIIGPWDEDLEYFEECKNLVNLLNVKDLEFTGKVDVKKYLGKMDILVLTSISEGQPLAILEGMACKKPYVSTNVGCVKDLLYGINDEFGEAGIVCPVMDYESIAKAIIKIVSNKDLMFKMGETAYKRVHKYYSIEKFKDDFINLYKETKSIV